MKHFQALEQLFGAYLHEDWADDYADLWDAVDSFARRQPVHAPAVRGEVEQVLAACESEAALEECLERLGLIYYPPGAGWASHRAWLLAVADRVEQTLRRTPAA